MRFLIMLIAMNGFLFLPMPSCKADLTLQTFFSIAELQGYLKSSWPETKLQFLGVLPSSCDLTVFILRPDRTSPGTNQTGDVMVAIRPCSKGVCCAAVSGFLGQENELIDTAMNFDGGFSPVKAQNGVYDAAWTGECNLLFTWVTQPTATPRLSTYRLTCNASNEWRLERQPAMIPDCSAAAAFEFALGTPVAISATVERDGRRAIRATHQSLEEPVKVPYPTVNIAPPIEWCREDWTESANSKASSDRSEFPRSMIRPGFAPGTVMTLLNGSHGWECVHHALLPTAKAIASDLNVRFGALSNDPTWQNRTVVPIGSGVESWFIGEEDEATCYSFTGFQVEQPSFLFGAVHTVTLQRKPLTWFSECDTMLRDRPIRATRSGDEFLLVDLRKESFENLPLGTFEADLVKVLSVSHAGNVVAFDFGSLAFIEWRYVGSAWDLPRVIMALPSQ